MCVRVRWGKKRDGRTNGQGVSRSRIIELSPGQLQIYSNQVKWKTRSQVGVKVFFRVLNEDQWQSVYAVKENKENSAEIKKLESGQLYEVAVAATVVEGEKTFESRHVKRFVL